MKTIRNVAFALLCATLYLTPAPMSAASGCSASLFGWPYSDTYVGTCDHPTDCGEAWVYAINQCDDATHIMQEFSCTGYADSFSYRCMLYQND